MFTARIACAAPGCTNHVPAGYIRHGNETGLCAGCTRVWRKYGLALGGFVPQPTIDALVDLLIDHVKPTKEQVREAIRYARGPRYPEGLWQDRPAYSLQKLIHGRWNIRLPHLMMCRSRGPTVKAIARGYSHYQLARLTMSTGSRYNRWLAGCTFMGRSGAEFPDGRWGEILLGDRKTPLYHFKVGDLEIIGTHALRSAERLGLHRDNHELLTVISEFIHERVLGGDLHPFVRVPLHARRSKMNSRHPLAHMLVPKTRVPRQYHGKYRRQTGLIDGIEGWPIGIEREPPKPKPPPPPAPPAPSTDWLFRE